MFWKTAQTLPGEALFLLHGLSLLPPSDGAAEQGGLLEQGKEVIRGNRRLHETGDKAEKVEKNSPQNQK